MPTRILTPRRAVIGALVVLATALPLPAAAAPPPTSKPRTLLLVRTMEAACPPDVLTEDGFLDVAEDNPHERGIDCAYWWGIVNGIESLASWPEGEGRAPGVRFGPERGATRGQAASLVARLIDVSGGDLPPGEDAFPDDEGSPHEPSIDALAAAGLVEGRADGTYGVDEPLDRGAATSLVIRAMGWLVGDAEPGLPPPGGDVFDDDDGSPHEPAIDTAADGGIMGGTADGGFHPTDAIRRDQLTSIVSRGLDWLVENGHVAPLAGEPAGFQGVPDALPEGKPGDLIKSEPLDQSPAGGTAYRVMYHSQSVDGRDIAVTGTVVVPAGTAPEGGWPIMSIAHGTTGIADQCAPSLRGVDDGVIPFVQQGWLTATTDYEGLGTPGRHPYLSGLSEGRGIIDIVRAARQLAPDAGTSYAVWGNSQGGHAAAFAAQLASTWAPELEQVGAVVSAPASEMPLIVGARGESINGRIVQIATGLNAAHPDTSLERLMTDEALALSHLVDTSCDAVHAAFRLPNEQVWREGEWDAEPWPSILRAENPGEVAFDVPVLITHGTADATVPPVLSQLLFERMCGLGQVVERRTYEGATHGGVVEASRADVLAWVSDRFAGVPAERRCPE